jgi:EAL domain-containing protein (putative c-di-GMP-specific phosphodiesterase class I)
LGDRILEKACEQNNLWQKAGLPPRVITVNISPQQFNQADFAAKVLHALVKTGLQPCWLELEIKEDAIMENVAHAIEVMDVLGRVGVSFAIDDFGKGYSSLTQLRHLPLAKLKIDRAFTRQVPGNPLDAKLVGAVVAVAQCFGMQTVAEGMETQSQCDFFKELKCDLVQGYLFGAPKSADVMGEDFERPVSCLSLS